MTLIEIGLRPVKGIASGAFAVGMRQFGNDQPTLSLELRVRKRAMRVPPTREAVAGVSEDLAGGPVNFGGRNERREHRAGKFEQSRIRVGQSHGVSWKAAGPQKRAQPFAIPGRRTGEDLMPLKGIHQPPGDDLRRHAFADQSFARNSVDGLGRRIPIRPFFGGQTRNHSELPSSKTQATSMG